MEGEPNPNLQHCVFCYKCIAAIQEAYQLHKKKKGKPRRGEKVKKKLMGKLQ